MDPEHSMAQQVVSTAATRAFFKECSELLGSERVVDRGERLESVSRDPVFTCSPPVGAVYPGSTKEVAEIVKLAGKHQVKIWVYSTALNWGYCNTAGEKGCVLMILNRMNRILRADEELAYVEIEPGVTYRQLNEYLKENKLRLWTDCTGGPPTGSVLGNALDRGVGVTPYSDHFAQICGMEVVLADGSIIRTGNFDNDSSGPWHCYPGAGPILEGLFSQSNFGIVVRAGLWLMPEPEHFEVGSMPLKSASDLPEAVDALRELMLAGDLPGKGRISNDVSMLTLLTQACAEPALSGEKHMTKDDISILKKRHGVAAWSGSYGIYGSREMVRAAKRRMSKKFRRFGKLTFLTDKKVRFIEDRIKKIKERPDSIGSKLVKYLLRRVLGYSVESIEQIPRFMDIHRGIPNESVVRRAYFHDPEPRPEENVNVARDGIGVLWFVPLIPFRGAEVVEYLGETGAFFAKHQIDQMISITPLNPRVVVPLMGIFYDRNDEESSRSATSLFRDLHEHAIGRGYQQFRCGHTGWERLFELNPELGLFLDSVKNSLDPDHVLAPGRYGIGLKGEREL